MRVTTKGQVTIPQPIREQLGVRAGDDVEFVRDGDQVVVRKTPSAEESREALAKRVNAWLDAFIGSGKGGPYHTTDEALDDLRGRED